MSNNESFEIYDILAFEIHETYVTKDVSSFKRNWQELKSKNSVWKKWLASCGEYHKYTTAIGDTIEYFGVNERKKRNIHYCFKINDEYFWSFLALETNYKQ